MMHRVVQFWRRRGDSNSRIKVLQTSALTTWLRRPIFIDASLWCRGGDLNSYGLSSTAPSRPRVYRFHHLGPPETFVGRGARIRTPDLRFWRPLLYQLSYTPRLYLDQLQVAISPSKYSIENQVFTPVECESWKFI